MTSPLTWLYGTGPADRAIFGSDYRPPVSFDDHGWHTVVRLEKSDSDGQPVEIDESRMPARFYRLRALESIDSGGEVVPGFTLSTGSGQEVGQLIYALGKAIAAGMIGLDSRVDRPSNDLALKIAKGLNSQYRRRKGGHSTT